MCTSQLPSVHLWLKINEALAIPICTCHVWEPHHEKKKKIVAKSCRFRYRGQFPQRLVTMCNPNKGLTTNRQYDSTKPHYSQIYHKKTKHPTQPIETDHTMNLAITSEFRYVTHGSIREFFKHESLHGYTRHYTVKTHCGPATQHNVFFFLFLTNAH